MPAAGPASSAPAVASTIASWAARPARPPHRRARACQAIRSSSAAAHDASSRWTMRATNLRRAAARLTAAPPAPAGSAGTRGWRSCVVRQGHRLPQEPAVHQRLRHVPHGRCDGRPITSARPHTRPAAATRKQYVAWAPSLTSSSATRFPGSGTKNHALASSPPGVDGRERDRARSSARSPALASERRVRRRERRLDQHARPRWRPTPSGRSAGRAGRPSTSVRAASLSGAVAGIGHQRADEPAGILVGAASRSASEPVAVEPGVRARGPAAERRADRAASDSRSPR